MVNNQKVLEVLYGITLGVLIPHCFSWSISMTLAFLPSFYTQDSLLMILQLLYRSISSNQRAENLRNELNALVTWATIWQLSWSLKKCNVLRITRSNRPITYNYIAQGSSIPLVSFYANHHKQRVTRQFHPNKLSLFSYLRLAMFASLVLFLKL